MDNELLEGAEYDEIEGEEETLLSSWRAEGEDVSTRLDVFVTAKLAGATRSESQRLIELSEEESGGVRVNGRRLKSNYKLRAGDQAALDDILREVVEPSHVQFSAPMVSLASRRSEGR